MSQLDLSGFNVPETPYRATNPALSEFADRMMQQKHYDYQLQREKEADDWKKLGLIQDMTDLSKHQTGSDVANAIGNQKADDIFKKYTALSGNMSPAELAFNIQKDMGGLVTSLDGIKNELEIGDKQAAQIKQLYPDLDVAGLVRDFRADVINRHIKTGTDFNNPMDIKPSQFDLSNPEFLSKYVTGDKSLREYFSAPKGLDKTTVFKGNPDRYTKYEATVPSWRKLNYDPETAKGGFINVEPNLGFKSQTLPSDALPSSKGKPFDMMDEDVYRGVSGKEKMELIRATRQKFGEQYNGFNDKEKEYAQRNVLLDYAKTFDQSNFHPTDVHTPSASLLKFYAGGSSGGGKGEGDVNINDLLGRIDKKVSSVQSGHGFPINELDNDEMDFVVSQAKKLSGNNDITQADFYLQKGDDGKVRMYLTSEATKAAGRDTPLIGALSYTGTNLKVQPGVKEKRAVIERGKTQTVSPKKNDPLGIFD